METSCILPIAFRPYTDFADRVGIDLTRSATNSAGIAIATFKSELEFSTNIEAMMLGVAGFLAYDKVRPIVERLLVTAEFAPELGADDYSPKAGAAVDQAKGLVSN